MHAGLLRLLVGLAAVLLLTVAIAAPAIAQEEPLETVPDESEAAGVEDVLTQALIADGLDIADWTALAERAEEIMLRGVASRFTLTRLRVDLVEWRDVFSGLLDKNERRLDTIAQQISALGAAPAEGEDEAAAVAERRAKLNAQQHSIIAPRLLVNEAYARVDGLIREADRLLRVRQTNDLLVRSASPLNPVYWSTALADIWAGVRDIGAELVLATRHDMVSGDGIRKLPLTVLYFGLAYILILRARRWFGQRQIAIVDEREHALSAFVLSIGQIAAMLIGLVALTLAVVTLDVPGVRSSAVLDALPVSGAVIIVGYWLAAQFFPPHPLVGPLGYNDAVRKSAKWYATALAWVTGLWLPYSALLQSGNISAESNAVLTLPVVVILGVLLLRFGRLIQSAPMEDLPANIFQQGNLRKTAGRFCVAVAILSPVLAAVGYATAAEAVLLPTILSLATFGILIYLQKLVNDVYAVWADSQDRQSETLVPVLIGFILLALSIPVLALIWGASWSELAEVWTRFREGFSVGETRLSPTDFMTFVLVFIVGYMLTRLIQSTLRRSVLPRTRLDLGAQNAVVAGCGYVGIGLAVIIAVTSAGIDLSSLAIVAGALSVGIGFGLQNIVSNFVSGIILLIERPVSEGDWIEVGGQMGYVRDISVRSTRIETFDRTDVIIPNADLVSGQVTNWTRGNLVGRVIVPVGVAYGSDVRRVSQVLQEIAEAHPMVLMTPPPAVIFNTFGASSLDFEIRAILRDVNFVITTKSEINFEISRRFAEEGIEIPFPQQDIWVRNADALVPPKT